MIDPIVHSSGPVTLIGGGEATPEDLQEALTMAPICVAADGGATLAVESGVALQAVIGDFDSLSGEVRARLADTIQHVIAEQDSTDFEKSLARITAPVVLGVGFLGGRMDHQLAALHVLARFAHRPCVLLGAQDLVFLAPPEISLPTVVGDVVSLFPLAAVNGRSTGLEWPIEGLAFDPLRQIGTSNRATGPCTLTMDRPAMMVMVPRRLIQPVVSQMTQAHASRWPAPE